MAYFPPLFVFLVILTLNLSHAGLRVVAEDWINTVCTETRNGSYCSAVLRSVPRSATANLISLGHAVIDLTRSNVTATHNKIKALIGQTKNPVLIRDLNDCLSEYDSAIAACENANKDLNDHFYTGVHVAAASISNAGTDCEDTFTVGPTYPSPLTSDNQNTALLAEIIGVISLLLKP